MLKLMGKKIFTIYAQKFCLSKPIPILLNFDLVNLQHSSCNHVVSTRVENSVDPDQMALSEVS